MTDYKEFVTRKLSTVTPTGIAGAVELPDSLFPHQRALTAWALRRGRAAIFADTGLGKMRMELVWAAEVNKHTGQPRPSPPARLASCKALTARSTRISLSRPGLPPRTWPRSQPRPHLNPPRCSAAPAVARPSSATAWPSAGAWTAGADMEQTIMDLRPADIPTARAVGRVAQQLATDRAERDAPGFRERVRAAVLERLAQGPASGEDLTAHVAASGIPFADGRSLGGIYQSMKRDGLIRIVPGVDVPRKHGHGTSGGRLWERC